MYETICIISPVPIGGVKTLLYKLYRALSLEGMNVDVYVLGHSFPPFAKIIGSDLNELLLSLKKRCSKCIYLGNIPKLGMYIRKSCGEKILLTLSGHPLYELYKTSDIISRLGSCILYNQLKIFTNSRFVDKFIVHTYSVCSELNLDLEHVVLLRQFLLPEEVQKIHYLATMLHQCSTLSEKSDDSVRIHVYLSYANLPGLRIYDLIKIIKAVIRGSNKRIILQIKDPKLKGFKRISNNIIMIGKQTFRDHIRWLLSSDIYVETSIDDELRFTTLEAMSLGVPVAKVVLPKYVEYIDYNEKDVILSHNLQEFTNKLADVINNLDSYRKEYSLQAQRFVLSKRMWNNVKYPLMHVLTN